MRKVKRTLRRFVDFAVRNETIWRKVDSTFISLSKYVTARREKLVERPRRKERVFEFAGLLCPERRVLRGPFKGLCYGDVSAQGSTLLPKLIGSYERELSPLLEELFRNTYSTVVNIGCGEGYYAVGTALRLPQAQIVAFDSNRKAVQACRDLAKLNGVESRVEVRGNCDQQVLLGLDLGERSLVICDCEGYEKRLFTSDVRQFLSRHDILIEVHDGLDLSISPSIKNIFSDSHSIKVVDSLSDIHRAHLADYPELSQYPLEVRHFAVAERRANCTGWLFLEARGG